MRTAQIPFGGGTRASVTRKEWSVNELIAAFALSQRRRGLSEATILRRVACLIALEEMRPLAVITSTEVEEFLDSRGLAGRTRYCWLSHLSAFYQWAQREELLTRNPTARLQRPRLRRLVPHPTPEADVQLAIAAAPTAMVRQWVVLMAYAGLRCCEVASLTGDMVELAEGTVRVHGKGDKWRVIPLHCQAVAVLRELPDRGPCWLHPGNGLPYTAQQVSSIVGRHLKALGCRNARAHRLRHRFATALLDSGVDISVVAELLGHESLETTRGYAAVHMRHLRAAVEGI